MAGCRDWDPDEYCGQTIVVGIASNGDDVTDEAVGLAVQNFEIVLGTTERNSPMRKTMICSIWCDTGVHKTCHGQPRISFSSEVRGVNYGGRFIPEKYLWLPGTQELFQGVARPEQINGGDVKDVGLCDVGEFPDAERRMKRFLDQNIAEEHFKTMADHGFNVVRLPLGYWNIVDRPRDVEGAPLAALKRYKALENILPAASYRPWIDRIFSYAKKYGLLILLDLHGAPGGQTSNVFTGCDQGSGNVYFDEKSNRELATAALAALAFMCVEHADTCYGIELLNEPAGTYGPWFGRDGDLRRTHLRQFYIEAMTQIRRVLPTHKPVIINEWPAWLTWWMEQEPLSYDRFGRVIFSSHLYYYGDYVTDQSQARKNHLHDLNALRTFFLNTPHEVLVTEYALNGHGSGMPQNDVFQYNRFVNWFVHQMNRNGIGSMVWNFDSSACAWGPVNQQHCGRDVVEWRHIFSSATARGPSVEVDLHI